MSRDIWRRKIQPRTDIVFLLLFLKVWQGAVFANGSQPQKSTCQHEVKKQNKVPRKLISRKFGMSWKTWNPLKLQTFLSLAYDQGAVQLQFEIWTSLPLMVYVK